MARGRKPKPTILKVIAGNPGKRRLPKNEPKPEPSIPPCPPHLGDEAKFEWHRLSHELYRLGLLSNIDGNALACYCEAFGTWVQANKAIRKMAETDEITAGLMIRTKGGNVIQNPMVGVRNRAMEIMNKLAAEFGMTPSSRARVASDATRNPGGGPAPRTEEDEEAEFFGDA